MAERAAPLAEAVKPVLPVQAGGQFEPLSAAGVEAIADNAFRILDRVGFADPTPHCIETCTAVGAVLGDDGRLRMPRSLVERTLQQARRNLVLHGQNPRWDLDLSGARVHFSTAGAAVMVADSEKGLYRDSEAQDLYDMARIADTCEHIHMFQRTCVPRDIPDNYALDINTLYCCVMGTSKHVGSSWTVYQHLEKSLQMLHMIAGGEAEWRARPFVSQSNCFVVPPLKFAHRCPRMLAGSGAGRHAGIAVVGRPGRCDGACLSGRDGLSSLGRVPRRTGLCERDQTRRTGDSRSLAIRFGPAYRCDERRLAGAGPAVRRLRPGGNHFDLPFGTACGMSDAKFPDFQAGAERAATVLSAALSGANIVYECAGMYASLLGTCPESLLLDNDLLGSVGRATRGIEVNSDTLSFAEIEQICSSGVGHYLGSGNTLQVMQSEYYYPDFSDRTSPTVWEEQGKPVLLNQAIEKTQDILAHHVPRHVSDEVDAQMRAEFPIFLSRAAMGR